MLSLLRTRTEKLKWTWKRENSMVKVFTKENASGTPPTHPFLGVCTINLSRFEVHLSCSVRFLRRDSMSPDPFGMGNDLIPTIANKSAFYSSRSGDEEAHWFWGVFNGRLDESKIFNGKLAAQSELILTKKNAVFTVFATVHSARSRSRNGRCHRIRTSVLNVCSKRLWQRKLLVIWKKCACNTVIW